MVTVRKIPIDSIKANIVKINNTKMFYFFRFWSISSKLKIKDLKEPVLADKAPIPKDTIEDLNDDAENVTGLRRKLSDMGD